ncbi:hypothetical protein ATANTOWER_015400 [Ataeniobius toweri]|uniref:Uncharacterized protein n=1 Tax=Ataeniobius toweri TaxID=208326 RepID=A0ABU7BHR6_9TELE|nr:hypothetical protein [Ataeniobius toweri]
MPTAGHPADCQRDSLTVSVFQWVVEAVPVSSRLMLRKLHMYCVTKTFTTANRTGTGWLIQVVLMTRCMFRCGSRWLPLQRTLLSSAVRHQEAEANSGKDFSYLPPLPGQDSALRWAGKKFEELPIVHIKATYNNTHIQLTDSAGQSLVRTSCGTEGFKNIKKSTPIAAQTAGISAAAVSSLLSGPAGPFLSEKNSLSMQNVSVISEGSPASAAEFMNFK